jgi:hypothetical protein
MFGDISNDESDHWNPMSNNPIIPQSQQQNREDEEEVQEDDHVNTFYDWSYMEDEEMQEVQEVSPSIGNKKRKVVLSYKSLRKPSQVPPF